MSHSPRFRHTLIATAIAQTLFMGAASAATITVANNNDADAGSLRQAILDANPAGGDIIDFAPGLSGQTITLSTGEMAIAKSLTIDGDINNDGTADITIDGNNASRIFSISGGNAVTVNIDGLTITKGYVASNGGAINLIGTNGNTTNLNITNSVLLGNSNSGTNLDGGAIYSSYSDLSVTSSTLSGNVVSDDGGAIFIRFGSLTITNSVLSGNQTGGASVTGNAHSGGAIGSFATNITIANSTLSGNSANKSDLLDTSTYGGAIGIYAFASKTLSITGTTITGNSSSNIGGGLGLEGVGLSAVITNSTISNNASENGGGIGEKFSATVTALNVTVSGNSASISGGGISGGTVNLSNTIIANSTGADCVITSLATNTNNFFGDATCDGTADGDPLLGPLASNGGPTQTMALQVGSPAIDAGNNAAAAALTWDQRGDPYSRFVNSTVDIGAYEFAPLAPPAPINVGATAGLRSASVTFDPVDGATSYTATCTSSNGGVTNSATSDAPPAPPVVVNNLTAGKDYTCTVTASDGINASDASAPSNVVVPLAPPTPSNPIPTLSEWGQMLMALVMMVTAGWFGRRAKQP